MTDDQMTEIHRMIEVAVGYQDGKYGSFASDVAGVRLAVACLEDEVAEVKDAWRSERKPKRGTRAWAATTSEVMDVVAVGVRLLRDMGVGTDPVDPDVAAEAEQRRREHNDLWRAGLLRPAPTDQASDGFEARVEYGHQTVEAGWVPEARGIKYATHQRTVQFRASEPVLIDHWTYADHRHPVEGCTRDRHDLTTQAAVQSVEAPTEVSWASDPLANPLARCDRCGRSTWAPSEVGAVDEMTQPSGLACGGRFR